LFREDAHIADEHVIAEALPIIVFVARDGETIEYVNRRFGQLTGLGAEPDATEAWRSVQHPDDRPRVAERWQRAIATGEEFVAELRIRTRDGPYRWHLMTAAKRQDEPRRSSRWYGTLIDIFRRLIVRRDHHVFENGYVGGKEGALQLARQFTLCLVGLGVLDGRRGSGCEFPRDGKVVFIVPARGV
jgi:PAS domain S-box-containing protein